MELVSKDYARVVYKEDTFNLKNNKKILLVERSKKPLDLRLVNDSTYKDIHVEAKNSYAFWLNSYPYFWVGFLVDWKSPKRYAYPTKIYDFDLDTVKGYALYNPNPKGTLAFQLSFPTYNSYQLKPIKSGYQTSAGWLGYTIGLDYFHQDDQFLSLTSTYVSSMHEQTANERLNQYRALALSYHAGLTNNIQTKNTIVGYGLCYTYCTSRVHVGSLSLVDQTNALGFMFPIYHRFGETFFAGLVYRPTFLQYSNSNIRLQYEHVLSVDFGWKWAIR